MSSGLYMILCQKCVADGHGRNGILEKAGG
jgi:hypothetical protein